MEFYVQYHINGEESYSSSLMTMSEVVKFIDSLDYSPIDEYHIFYSPYFGCVREAKYAGWHPNCYIAIIDSGNGDIIAEGYGTDH